MEKEWDITDLLHTGRQKQLSPQSHSPCIQSESPGGSWQDVIRQHANRFAKVQGTGYSILFDSDDFDSDEDC